MHGVGLFTCCISFVVCYSSGMSENMNPANFRRPVIVATSVLLGGIAVSLWFNLKAISLEPNADMGAYVSGVLWPLFLLVSIELLIHTPWRNGKADTAIKAGVLLLVGAVAAWISYWHGVHVLDFWGYDEIGKRVGPIVPDAAMALATLALQRVGQARRLVRDEVATVATPALANDAVAIVETMATGQLVATEGVATDDLDRDWASLEDEVASWVAEERQAVPAEELEPVTAPTKTATLTTVPAAAAEAIRAGLEASMDPKELDAKIGAEFDRSDRAARRWRAAVANGTARLSYDIRGYFPQVIPLETRPLGHPGGALRFRQNLEFFYKFEASPMRRGVGWFGASCAGSSSPSPRASRAGWETSARAGSRHARPWCAIV